MVHDVTTLEIFVNNSPLFFDVSCLKIVEQNVLKNLSSQGSMLAPALYGIDCYGMTPSGNLRIKTTFYIGHLSTFIAYCVYCCDIMNNISCCG